MRFVGFLMGALLAGGALVLAILYREVAIKPASTPLSETTEQSKADKGAAGSESAQTRAEEGGPAGNPPLEGQSEQAISESAKSEPTAQPPQKAPSGAASNMHQKSPEGVKGGTPEANLGLPQEAKRPALPSQEAGPKPPVPLAEEPEPSSLPGTEPNTTPQPEPQTPPQSKGGQSVDLGSLDQGGGIEEPRWQPFWGPFNTLSSAKGFAKNLTKQTGLQIRPIEPEPGSYMVAYPYHSESERTAVKEEIEEQTGLRLRLR